MGVMDDSLGVDERAAARWQPVQEIERAPMACLCAGIFQGPGPTDSTLLSMGVAFSFLCTWLVRRFGSVREFLGLQGHSAQGGKNMKCIAVSKHHWQSTIL